MSMNISINLQILSSWDASILRALGRTRDPDFQPTGFVRDFDGCFNAIVAKRHIPGFDALALLPKSYGLLAKN